MDCSTGMNIFNCQFLEKLKRQEEGMAAMGTEAGQMVALLVEPGKPKLLHPHCSHTGSLESFSKTLHKTRFGKDQRKAWEIPGSTQMELDVIWKVGKTHFPTTLTLGQIICVEIAKVLFAEGIRGTG